MPEKQARPNGPGGPHSLLDTRCLSVKPDSLDLANALREPARVLREGGLVAFPTETVYGLGANALDPTAVAKIFQAKGRPADNPLIVHISGPAALDGLVTAVPEAARVAAARFWPGPLTVVLPRAAAVPDAVSAGLPTVALRMPAHPVALALIDAAGVPVAAPSANASGRPSPTQAAHVLDDLAGKIDFVIDAGPTEWGVESTVVDFTGDVPVVLRPGGVTVEQLREVLGEVRTDPALSDPSAVARPRSPGMKYTHYAPRAAVTLISGERGKIPAAVRRLLEEHAAAGAKVALLLSEETGAALGREFYSLGPADKPEEAAARLYGLFRQADRDGAGVIIAEGYPERGIGAALMNRLRKAARNIIEA